MLKNKIIMALFFASLPVQGFTQENQNDYLEEIVVTATKTGARNIQDIPASISAFDADTLERQGLYSASDLASLVPSLEVTSVSQLAIISIRGIGTNNTFAGGDPSTTSQIDGVYIGRPSAQMYDFIDVERIEVLRGPQGTLYGRNSNAGTINVITRNPSSDFEASLRSGVGNYGRLLTEGRLSTPLTEDMAASLAGRYKKHGSFVKNLNPSGPKDVWFDEYYAFRGKLMFTPNGQTNVVVAADYLNEEGSPITYYARPSTPGHPIGDNGLSDLDGIATPDIHTTSVNETNTLDVEAWGLSMTAEHNYDTVSVKNITAYRSSSNNSNFDLDFSAFEMLHTAIISEDQWQFTEDLQIYGSTEKLNWILGVFYFYESAESFFNLELHPTVSGTNLLQTQGINTDTNSFAIYGQGTYSLTQQLNLTIGTRYTIDKKKANNFGGFEAFPDGFPTDPTQQVSGAGSFDTSDTITFKSWTPKIALEYRVSDNLLTYVSVTKGFKSGGYNLLVASQPISYDPETVWSFEGGFKSNFLDNRGLLNIAGFIYNYDGYQVLQFGEAGAEFVSNVNAVKVSGLEIESAFQLNYIFSVGANIAFLSATYEDPNFEVTNNLTLTRVNADSNRLSNAPKQTWTAFIDLHKEVNIGTIRGRFELAYKGDVFFSPANNVAEASNAYTLVNASLSYTSTDDKWELQLVGKNLNNANYFSAAASFVMPVAIPNPPRTLMGFVKLNF